MFYEAMLTSGVAPSQARIMYAGVYWAGPRWSSTAIANTELYRARADTLEGQWSQVKRDVKTQWGKLTDKDLEQIAGQSEKLVGKLQERYGYHRDRAEREISDFEAQQSDTLTEENVKEITNALAPDLTLDQIDQIVDARRAHSSSGV
jgi:uncharacterized protein YjbJ (UPF0337 family)